MKTLAKSIIRSTPLSAEMKEKLLFFGKQGYWPDFENPRSYSEKVNWRKLRSSNELYVQCSDKVAARDYVGEKIGEEFLIPLLYSGAEISPEQLHALGDDIVVKANHDSGSVCIIRDNTGERAAEVCKSIKAKLEVNYGKTTNEWWYTRIRPQVCVERYLANADGTPAWDFKFFVFRGDGSEAPKILIEVDFDRNTPDHRRNFYDGDRNIVDWVEADVLIDGVPNDGRPFPEIENYEKMRQAVLTLAADFDHVRVDMYHVDGRIYFGELTFSEGGGRSRWSPREFDFLLGKYWDLDREPGGSERPCDVDDKIVEQRYLRQDPARRLNYEARKRLNRIGSWLGVAAARTMRFFALPYAVVKMVDWDECTRNPILVSLDHLYIFFVLKYFPDNYASCRLWDKPRSEWKYYYGRGYDPLAIAKRNRRVRRPECAVLFEDKEVCHALCQSFMLPQPHQYGVLDPGDDLVGSVRKIFATQNARRVFIKPVDGDGGRGSCIAQLEDDAIVVRQVTEPERAVPLENFALKLRSVLQEGVEQHPRVAEMFPQALSTIRIATMFTPQKDIIVVGAIMRIGTGCHFVDNGGQGGLASLIDLESGRLAEVATDNRGRPCSTHPDTGFAFADLIVPFWEDTLELSREVQRHFASFNRFLGMDIGISKDGPVLVEVNDIFGSGLFESVAGPMLKDEALRRHFVDYGLITHNKFNKAAHHLR